MSIKKSSPYLFSIYNQDVGYKFLGQSAKKEILVLIKVMACGCIECVALELINIIHIRILRTPRGYFVDNHNTITLQLQHY